MTTNKREEYPIKQIELSTILPNICHEPRFSVDVISNTQIAKNNIIRLKRPKRFVFKPGQYIWLVLPELSKKHGSIDRRAYTIASSNSDEWLEISVHLLNNDFISNIKALQPNDKVEIIGPMGSAFIIPSNGAILIADNIGVAQFLSTLRSNIHKNISIIICDSDSNLPFDKKEFNRLTDTKDTEIIYTKSKPQIKDFKNIINEKDKRPVFISGHQNFVNHITEILLSHGVHEKQLHFEENYPQIDADIQLKNTVDSYINHVNKQTSAVKPDSLNNLFLEMTKKTNSHIILTDRNGHILFANQAAINLTGYSFNEMSGQTPRLWGGLTSDASYRELWSNLKHGVAIKGTVMNRQRNGNMYIAFMTIIPIVYEGVNIAYISTEDDVTLTKELDKAKSEYIPIISHQLRTLLSVISWYTEMLIDGDAGKLSIKQRKYLKAIFAGNQRMVELLNSLLNVSKIELGALSVESTPVDMPSLANSVADEQKLDIHTKKIAFSITHDKGIPIVQTDPKLLRMIIQNLLSNAIKYTENNGKIDIIFSLFNKKYIQLKVTDNGFGIPKKQHSKIFTKLFRADNAKRKDSEGTGLGLYIVKSVVEKIGGKIWFESEENKGTTFYVLIPIESNGKK